MSAFCGIRCGTIASGDSSGSVKFWDGQFGTLLQAHSNHKGDVNALAAAPTHNIVFSAGSDGQVYSYASYACCGFGSFLLFHHGLTHSNSCLENWSSNIQSSNKLFYLEMIAPW